MKPITLEQLYAAIGSEVNKGNGKKIVLVADDDEGNGYHPIYFSVTPMERFDEEDLAWCNLHGMTASEAKANGIVIG